MLIASGPATVVGTDEHLASRRVSGHTVSGQSCGFIRLWSPGVVRLLPGVHLKNRTPDAWFEIRLMVCG